jgi:glycosidase
MHGLAAVLVLALAAPAAPAVSRVEPPSWWAGHSLNPVRLMLTGRGLAGATLEPTTKALRVVGTPAVSANGHYLFADVHIDPSAAVGAHPLALRTAGGRAAVRFEILPPVDRAAHFRGFTADDVIYLAMPDRFANGDPRNDDPAEAKGLHDRAKSRYYHGGDLQGVIDRLPYLKELGITALWLNPWYENSDALNRREVVDGSPITDYHGYGAVDFYGVDEHLGDLASLRRLREATRAAGIRLVQDQVANHTGPYHPWASDPPTPTWYTGTPEKHPKNVWQTWTLQDPYGNAATRYSTLEGWFIDILPDLDQEDPEVARYLIQNSLWWVGVAGLDAIRQDTLPYVPRAYWRDWTAALRREHPELVVLGELYDGDPVLVSYYQAGREGLDGIDTGIQALFDFPLYYPVRRAFAEGKAVREVAQMLARDRLYARPDRLVTFLGLHDVKRFMSEPGATPEGLKLAWTFLFTTRGLPLVYYGDEIAMAGAEDPDNRRDFPGGFPGDVQDAFRAAGRTAAQQDVWAHVQRLAKLRRERPALRRGRLSHLLVEEQHYVYARILDGQAVVVAINNAAEPATLEVDLRAGGVEATSLGDLLGAAREVSVTDGHLRLTLPARAAAVLAP